MKAIKHLLILGSLVLLGNACAMRAHVADLEAISMKSSVIERKKFKRLKPSTVSYCPKSAWASGKRIGLIDTAVRQMETESKADFLLNASIFTVGNCLEISATPAVYE